MNIKTIDAGVIQKCFLAGAGALDAKKELINDLNVFPVPDGDTGTNMTMTILSAAREVAALENPDMKELCKAISSGSLRGARGNSGVILSQLLRGFTKEIAKADAVDVDILTKAFERAVESAYKAVMKPKEGTILTVARAGSEKALELIGRTDNMAEFANKVILHMRDVLNQTPDMLPVLKAAGVVDSGGEGLLTVLEGAYDAMIGKEVRYEAGMETVSTDAGLGVRPGSSDADIKFGYCTEFIINPEGKFDSREEKKLKAYLGSIGDSIVCVADEDIVKVHVHTNDPGLAIQRGLSYGPLSNMKIDNMREEHNERVIQNAQQLAKQAEGETDAPRQQETALPMGDRTKGSFDGPAPEHKESGFISVSAGEGLREIFRDLGVDHIIEGGQTMNPSTEDILSAVDAVNADNVFILPNNGNIILAAEQAKDMVKEKNVFVIPTKNIPQGIAAMINFAEGLTAEENARSMTECLSGIKAGQVTYAVRDTDIGGKHIKAGDIMGLSGKTIETVGTDAASATIDLLIHMMDDDTEIVTIYYGEDASEEEAEKIARAVKEERDVEVEIHYGGQPVYYYFVSAE